ncbi:FecR domain-containing protein [Glaciimonas sp. Gout2]|uniref:FecR domain-containing protein n=1 Tax=unclassified Glaciimonas TaxID=2644401 RepID=UPI002B22D4DE|nr:MULTISPECIES: FecR domain-containing protein [unclassified Glaciimonas]MEB0010895.1 FecR domain-containing protein [Glaciimonas sp. Cout2]MEB0081677.1 FecR domain-containing protein [Glaciimonas sp. Gout2]
MRITGGVGGMIDKGVYLPPPRANPPGSGAKDFSVLQEAAEWFAVLRSEKANAYDHRRWAVWINATPLHAEAWSRVEAVNQQFGLLSAVPAHAALSAPGRQRRTLVKSLVALCVMVAVGDTALDTYSARTYLATMKAQYRTYIGRTRKLTLEDGTVVWLNTDSAVDVYYSGSTRQIRLRAGEILVQSAHDTQIPARPLEVSTPDGQVRALGTRFTVRYQETGSAVAVFEGAVEISPAKSNAIQLAQAGFARDFGVSWIGASRVSDESRAAWVNALLTPDNMRLDDFLAELGRYRHGYLGCAPEVAHLRLVGVYPLADTDRILTTLAATLPVHIRRRSSWWVTVEAI